MILRVQKTRPSLSIILAVLGMPGFLGPETALATTQFSDLLYLNGRKHPLESLPLEQYYSPGKSPPQVSGAQHGHLARLHCHLGNRPGRPLFEGYPGLDRPGRGEPGRPVSWPERPGGRNLVWGGGTS